MPGASSSKEKKKHTAVIVLGMHRSGTSALGGVLSQLGCDLPAHLMPAHESNPKGFFESMAIYELNDAILASGGSSWYDWLPFNRTWFQSPPAGEFADRAVEALREEFGGSSLFVMKDPRICRVFPFWANVLEAADIRPAIVHIHRNPLDVAASLRGRDGKDADLTQLVWLCHVLSAERDSRGMARSFVSYDQLLQNWAGLAERVGQALDIGWPRSFARVAATIDGFLTPSLHHHMQAKEQILDNPLASIWVREVYRILQHWAQDGEREEDHATLDLIAQEFEHSASAFARLVDRGVVAEEKARNAGSEVKELQAVLVQEKTRLVSEKTDLLKTIAEAENRETEARATLEQMKQALSRADDENDALREEVDQFRRALDCRQSEIAKLSVAAHEARDVFERNQALLVSGHAHDMPDDVKAHFFAEISVISKIIVEIDNIIFEKR